MPSYNLFQSKKVSCIADQQKKDFIRQIDFNNIYDQFFKKQMFIPTLMIMFIHLTELKSNNQLYNLMTVIRIEESVYKQPYVFLNLDKVLSTQILRP